MASTPENQVTETGTAAPDSELSQRPFLRHLERIGARIKPWLPVASALIFAGALWGLDRLLHEFHWHDVRLAFHRIPAVRVLAAIGFAVLSYIALSGYDALALRAIGRKVRYTKSTVVAWMAFALSNVITPSFLSGGAVRYRAYTALGIEAIDIARVIGICSLVGGMGLCMVSGFGLFFSPQALEGNPYVSPALAQLIGALLFLVPIVFVALSAVAHRSRASWAKRWPVPNVWIAMGQIAVATVDFTCSAAVLYVLLPEHAISFSGFLGIYGAALVIGLISYVPGGLGVFEGVFLATTVHCIPTDAALGALLVYRVIYYVAPLALVVIGFSTSELVSGRARALKATAGLLQAVMPLAPRFFSLCSALAGVVLLLSSATPALESRIKIMESILPLPVVELSHFLASIAGVLLLVLARSLQRRVDAAYWASLVLLALGAVFSLLKGLDYEEAIVLGVLFVAFVPTRKEFYRRASFFAPQPSVAWISMTLIAVTCSVWLGLFAFKHVEYRNELWWHFSHHGDASRFLRSTIGILVTGLVVSLSRLFAPRPPTPHLPTDTEMDSVGQIVRTCPSTNANLVLLRDKSILLDRTERAFVMYRVHGRSWIAMNGPFGDPEKTTELIWEFREQAERSGGFASFYQVRAEDVHDYVDAGFSILKLGEEARVHLPSFSLAGGAMREERYIYNKLIKENVTFRVAPVEEIPALLPKLRAVSDEWLAAKNADEKGFSLGFFDDAYVLRYPQAIVEVNGQIVAFANLWLGCDKQELSIDLMRHGTSAPKGVMDFLFAGIMLWAKEQGYQWFVLGMAPLAGLTPRPSSPLWNRVADLLYRHGEHFYNFKGLYRFKDKWNPIWEPRYLAFSDGLTAVETLTNITALISGGLLGIFRK